jgi:hypothetical protein
MYVHYIRRSFKLGMQPCRYIEGCQYLLQGHRQNISRSIIACDAAMALKESLPLGGNFVSTNSLLVSSNSPMRTGY